MNEDRAFTMGVGTIVACVTVSLILWYTFYRLVRWMLW